MAIIDNENHKEDVVVDASSLARDATDVQNKSTHKSTNGGFNGSSFNKSQQNPVNLSGVGALRNQSAPLRSVEPQMFNGNGNLRGSTKPSEPRPYNRGPRQYANSGPRYPLQGPHQQEAHPMYHHTMQARPNVPVPVRSYHPSFGPYPVQSHMPFHAIYRPSLADHVGFNSDSSKRKPDVQNQGFLHPWPSQQQVGSMDNRHFQIPTRPMPFRRPLFHPLPGSIDGPNAVGSSGPMGHVPYAPLTSARVPYPPAFVQRPPFPASGSSQNTELKTKIVKQIEYYFCDENLDKDFYLCSLMDLNGWVSISMIAGFKRIKRMNTNIPFILEALSASSTVEVQNDMVRRRDKWSNWVSNKSYLPVLSSPKNYVKSDTGLITTGNELGDDKEILEGTNSSPIIENLLASNPCKVSNHDCEGVNLTVSPIEHSLLQGKKTDKSSALEEQAHNELTHDFSSTFRIDEEVDLVPDSRSFHQSAIKRFDAVDDDALYADVVGRLLVDNVDDMSDAAVKGADLMSNDDACVISDVLKYYEQKVPRETTSNHSIIKDAPSRSPQSPTQQNLNIGFSKQQWNETQRLFISSSRDFATVKPNSIGTMVVSESSPSGSADFLLGSTTPPDNPGSRPSGLSASPCGNISAASPPVGSVPKPFPPFKHPSHGILEEKGFKHHR